MITSAVPKGLISPPDPRAWGELPAGCFCGGDTVPAGTFHWGDVWPGKPQPEGKDLLPPYPLEEVRP